MRERLLSGNAPAARLIVTQLRGGVKSDYRISFAFELKRHADCASPLASRYMLEIHRPFGSYGYSKYGSPDHHKTAYDR